MIPTKPKPSLLLKTALGGALALTLAACAEQAGDSASSKPDMEKAEASNTPELGTFGIETADMKPEVDPGDDFFEYVNGKWLDTFEIPAERSSYSSFTALFERSEERIRKIIEEAAETDAPAGSVEQKIGDYYAAFMDTDAIEAAGLAPIQDELGLYRSAESHEDVALLMVKPDLGTRTPFGVGVSIDAKQPDRYSVYIGQSGLSMPDREYYLDEKFADKADAYKEYLVTILSAAGTENAEQAAADVFAFEMAIAEIHWTRAERRDRDKTYNKYTLAELEEMASGFPWQMMMSDLGIADQDYFVVSTPSAIEGAAEVFANTPVETLQNYMVASAVRSYASVLPKEIDDAVFAFFSTELSGVPEQRPRWKRGVSAVGGALGEAVGEVYVERYFPPESKAQMEELVANLRVAFSQRLDELDWMGEETKAEAQAKLEAFTPKIGYPDKWTDYSALEVSADSPVANIRENRIFNHEDSFSQLGQPIDKDEWFMTPQTVNAYYSSTRNEIVFPAAILQAPFFDPNADLAVNYGGIGAVIGHEIGHGFDDQGRKSDGTGALRDWWTEEDKARFQEKADALGAQYATYEPVEGYPLIPNLTMGENIGDLGGMAMAYAAYKLATEGQDVPVIDGFTGDQRFFMAWAQVWKGLYREEALKRQISTGPHSPGMFRVNGIVRNMDAWYDAFEVTEDDDLYLPEDERVAIW
ncbi:M13 family metallopeptidase [Parvularcula sp. ZS-1/3]|uniref:M13 family metallopeptidase n=1 Tax=Parvularcula mediterranea TaxID=2732508 RepID=A0A7Y3RKK8_9PROT|nr:M13 family metallopeptidase [Parvularcula mediterranea]NNU15087.1 M13 family metallopeptidase [Parvularcula mediterranea]